MVYFGIKTENACNGVVIKKGMKGNFTKTIQGMLICKGYNTNGFDGVFGSGTENAVKQFQKLKNLKVDGRVGKLTLTALFK